MGVNETWTSQIYIRRNAPGRPLRIPSVRYRRYPPVARIRSRPLVNIPGPEVAGVGNIQRRRAIHRRGKGSTVILPPAILPQMVARHLKIHTTGTRGEDVENTVRRNGAALETYPEMVTRGIGLGAVVWTKVGSQGKDAR